MNHLIKIHSWLLIAVIGLFAQSCTEDNDGHLDLSSESFTGVSADGETLSVGVSSDMSWKVTSSQPGWCSVAPATGRGDGNVTVTVAPNIETATRRAVITVSAASGAPTRMVEVVQNASSGSIDDYVYDLPVIFHVLYRSESDPLQHVSATRLRDVLATAGRLYRHNHDGIDMRVTFSLATTDPDGKPLDTPGVEYVRWDEAYPIDCDAFMTDDSGRYVKYLWDPNRYINVMVYNFADDGESSGVTMGISHLPFSYSGSYLDGLSEVEYQTLTLDNLRFPCCVSINSLYINEQSTPTYYNPSDVTVTLAHELGHYLGLHHAFSESEDGGCEDTDYCADTPSYDREDYESYFIYLAETNSPLYTFDNLVKRTNCDGTTFTSRNIMDYMVCESDRFTPDQRARVRHVLMYSPLIPGPKRTVAAKSRAASSDMPLDLPIVTRR